MGFGIAVELAFTTVRFLGIDPDGIETIPALVVTDQDFTEQGVYYVQKICTKAASSDRLNERTLLQRSPRRGKGHEDLVSPHERRCPGGIVLG